MTVLAILVGWIIIGSVVVMVVYRWRSELKWIGVGQATRFGSGTGLGFLWFSGLLAVLWPVTLLAAIRRQVKYGEEEGPTE